MLLSRRPLAWIAIGLALLACTSGLWLYQRGQDPVAPAGRASAAQLVRPHAPVLGPADAPVTLVEFFDPACEACRSFHPFVRQILAAYPRELRLVLRYTPFHQGSDEAVAILETARAQDRFEAVLEALLLHQPQWADHRRPDLARAWEVAGQAGLDLARAKAQAASPEIRAVLQRDMADVDALGVHRTPTFYVNGTLLTAVHPQGLLELVRAELARVAR